MTISEYAKDAMKKYYGREAVVVHPPVEVDDFKIKVKKSQKKLRKKQLTVENLDLAKAYITTSRQVNWKRLDLAVQACLMTQRRLVVIGEGPEHKKLVKMAEGSDLIEFLPLMKKEELAQYLAKARGYLFPSLEPFGIAPVEALATGCPVIAYGVGGARDYVEDRKNGLLFEPQSAKALAETILKFEKMKFNRAINYPVIGLGASESMNFELSLPLIWLVFFDAVAFAIMVRKKVLFNCCKRIWAWLLFPIFLTLSVLWSMNSLRGVLTVGILWLVYFAGYAFIKKRKEIFLVIFRICDDNIFDFFAGGDICVYSSDDFYGGNGRSAAKKLESLQSFYSYCCGVFIYIESARNNGAGEPN